MQLADPTTTALDVLSRVEDPGWWSALPGILRTALAQWPGHPDLVDAAISLALDEKFVLSKGADLIPVLAEAADAVRKVDSAPLLAHAAQLSWIYEDPQAAFGFLVDALSADPLHPDARAFLSELIDTPDAAPEWCDGLETLAMRAVRGQVDRTAVVDILTECRLVCACPRAWSLLGK